MLLGKRKDKRTSRNQGLFIGQRNIYPCFYCSNSGLKRRYKKYSEIIFKLKQFHCDLIQAVSIQCLGINYYTPINIVHKGSLQLYKKNTCQKPGNTNQKQAYICLTYLTSLFPSPPPTNSIWFIAILRKDKNAVKDNSIHRSAHGYLSKTTS